MVKHLVMLALAIFLVSACVHAADTNSAVTAAEIQQMIDDLTAADQSSRSEIVTVRIDTETQQLFNKLNGKMLEIDQRLNLFEERLATLKKDITTEIENTSQTTISSIEKKTNTKIDETQKETEQYIRDMTNPIRINLPNLALWLMVTAAFMLTSGLRMKTAIKDAKKEIEDNRAVK